ncbi:hypothetical protein RJ639_013405 [Escallonia herrerae]|uniref:C2 domain-containing protein n=1 Tax=Escallonia herrerae TaxID=1293975 RepID=A0AA88VI10_9ASTE|nr:hypothetical protein RJ639_013405 [Escallonia herrerae]
MASKIGIACLDTGFSLRDFNLFPEAKTESKSLRHRSGGSGAFRIHRVLSAQQFFSRSGCRGNFMPSQPSAHLVAACGRGHVFGRDGVSVNKFLDDMDLLMEGGALIGAQKKSGGILHVKVVQARNLLNKDFLGISDPYVKLNLSGERLPFEKTSIKMNDLNPEWHEVFKLTVKDPQSQVLEVHVNDWVKESLGHVDVNLIDVVYNGCINDREGQHMEQGGGFPKPLLQEERIRSSKASKGHFESIKDVNHGMGKWDNV